MTKKKKKQTTKTKRDPEMAHDPWTVLGGQAKCPKRKTGTYDEGEKHRDKSSTTQINPSRKRERAKQ